MEENDMSGTYSIMGEMRKYTEPCLRRLKGRDHLEELDIDMTKILDCVLEKLDGRVWTGYIWLRIRTRGRAFVNWVMNLQVT
jgi:hypothetical protein